MELPGGSADRFPSAWASPRVRLRMGGKAQKPADRRVYVLLGDGECTEGQTWEGAGFGRSAWSDNLIAIVDYNKYIISSTTYDVMDLEPFEDRWRAYRWDVQRVDGHDVTAVREAVDKAKDALICAG